MTSSRMTSRSAFREGIPIDVRRRLARIVPHLPLLSCRLRPLAYAIDATAQTQSAALEGSVQDGSGGVVAAAAVTLRERDTNQLRTAVTDGQGIFRFAGVPPGAVRSSRDPRRVRTVYAQTVSLAIGQTARLGVVIRPAGVIESVAVSAEPPPLDSRQTSVTTTIGTERIEELPVRSRNYLEFVLLAPGVTRAQRQTAPGGASSTLLDSGFSFGGLRPRSNTLTIDGLDNNDEFTGATRTELSLEFVREFQVVGNGWAVENGGASAGGINVVTKSGVNTLHGDAFLFGQSGVFSASPKLEETFRNTPSLWRYRGGLALGGPLVKDRTFYYAAAEREQAQTETASDIDSGAAVAINHALSAGLLPEVHTRQLTLGLFPTARAETEWSAKVVHQLADGGAVVGRIASTDNREEHDAFNTGGLSDRSVRGTQTTRDVAVTGSWTKTLGRTHEQRAARPVRYSSHRLVQRRSRRRGRGDFRSGRLRIRLHR